MMWCPLTLVAKMKSAPTSCEIPIPEFQALSAFIFREQNMHSCSVAASILLECSLQTRVLSRRLRCLALYSSSQFKCLTRYVFWCEREPQEFVSVKGSLLTLFRGQDNHWAVWLHCKYCIENGMGERAQEVDRLEPCIGCQQNMQGVCGGCT